MGFKMKGHTLPGIKQRKSERIADGRATSSPYQKHEAGHKGEEKSEDKRKAEEIHTYSAGGSKEQQEKAREEAKERSQRVKDMTQAEWDEMKRKEAESKASREEKERKRKEEMERRKTETARRSALTPKEKRREDRNK